MIPVENGGSERFPLLVEGKQYQRRNFGYKNG